MVRLFCLLMLLSAVVSASEPWGHIELLGRAVAPGSSERFPAIPDPSYEASHLNVPVMVARGVSPGPTLCLTAGIHGDEMNGVEVARRAFSETDAAVLSGTLIALPIINAEGFRAGSRYLSDRRDLNRFWPGSEGGSVASFIANALFTQIISACDALIDLHTASFRRTNVPQIRVDADNARALAMARHFGDTTILVGKGPKGSLRRAAVDAGIPAIIYEAGEPLRFQLHKIEPGVRGVRNVLAHLGMIEGETKPVADDRIFRNSTWARVPVRKGGFFFPEIELGDQVTKGQTLGYIIDPMTDVRTPVLAHRAGEIIGHAVPQPVLTGYALFHIGTGGGTVTVARDEVH